MFEPWSVITTQATKGTDEELKGIYGEDAVISRVQGYNLIHLDSPEVDEIERRTKGFNPDDLFDDDCPLCRMMREEGVDVVFLGENDEDQDFEFDSVVGRN